MPRSSVPAECLPNLPQQSSHLKSCSFSRSEISSLTLEMRWANTVATKWTFGETKQPASETNGGQINGVTAFTTGGEHMDRVNSKWQCQLKRKWVQGGFRRTRGEWLSKGLLNKIRLVQGKLQALEVDLKDTNSTPVCQGHCSYQARHTQGSFVLIGTSEINSKS